MVIDQETAHAVNGIHGVIKFVGHERLPRPLRAEEGNRLLGISDDTEAEAPKEEIPFLVGQAVAITEGPFTDFNGTVEEVIADKGKVRVSVSLFGRPTSVELDYLQLKATNFGYCGLERRTSLSAGSFCFRVMGARVGGGSAASAMLDSVGARLPARFLPESSPSKRGGLLGRSQRLLRRPTTSFDGPPKKNGKVKVRGAALRPAPLLKGVEAEFRLTTR
jgi:hypothetical protein